MLARKKIAVIGDTSGYGTASSKVAENLLEKAGLERRVLVAAAEDVDALLVLAEHHRDIAGRRQPVGLGRLRLLAHASIVPRPTAKRPKPRALQPKLVYVKGSRQARQPKNP